MKKVINILPTLGIVLFLGLYIYATTLYPGGSQINTNSVGFDWIHNYWCDMFNEEIKTEIPNPSRPYAIVATIILCFSLMIFFIQFAVVYIDKGRWRNIVATSAVLSMGLISLVFTKFHNQVIVISSIFGLILGYGVVKAIVRSQLTMYKIIGAVCIILLVANNYIYYTSHFIHALPFLQKIMLLSILVLVLGLSIEMSKEEDKHNQNRN